MIFISHNSKDKAIVESIAMRLSSIFGQESVFYDSWSIQPGDGIIDKMDEGLSKCKLFLFFVSNNSLNSNMVRLEWQNAIMKMTNGQTKIIPVRLDNCIIPTILLQSLYIDLFQNGIETAIRQIVDIASGKNTFTPQFNKISNLLIFKSQKDNKTLLECTAQYYMEPIAKFSFATPNDPTKIDFTSNTCAMITHGYGYGNISCIDGKKYNCLTVTFPQSIVPGFQQNLILSPKTAEPIVIIGVLHEIKMDDWRAIPMIDK